jgi:hypothetical protein
VFALKGIGRAQTAPRFGLFEHEIAEGVPEKRLLPGRRAHLGERVAQIMHLAALVHGLGK